MVETKGLSPDELRELARHYATLMSDSLEMIHYAAARGLPLDAIYFECKKNLGELQKALEGK